MALSSCGGCYKNNEWACTHWNDYPIEIAATLDNEIDTINDLNEDLGFNLFQISDNGVPILYLSHKEFNETVHPKASAYAEANCSRRSGIITSGTIYLRGEKKYRIYEAFRNQFAHELIHLAGYFTHEDNGLMYTAAGKGYRGPLNDILSDETINYLRGYYN